MLSQSDTSLDKFLPVFSTLGVKIAFLVPTPTGFDKSIMDATSIVRSLLKESKIHDYELQRQGPDNKKIVTSYLVYSDHVEKTQASLYRPQTKHGDPRIWFRNLKKYCFPRNLLALIVYDKAIYIINLSDCQIADSILNKGYVYDILKQSVYEDESIAKELLGKLIDIHRMGFIPSITPGDPGVGDTLEHTLGINRNNSKLPDYKGIELKCTRITKEGNKRGKTRFSLFANTPDTGLTYREIVQKYGHWTFKKDKNENRLSIFNTVQASKPDSYGLILNVNYSTEELELCYDDKVKRQAFSYWYFNTLKQRLLEKHHETFWIDAQSIRQGEMEFFRYDKVTHTKRPNDSLFFPLIEEDKITVDLAGYFSKEKNMRWRDHGLLFKIWNKDLELLFGKQKEYDLEKLAQ